MTKSDSGHEIENYFEDQFEGPLDLIEAFNSQIVSVQGGVEVRDIFAIEQSTVRVPEGQVRGRVLVDQQSTVIAKGNVDVVNASDQSKVVIRGSIDQIILNSGSSCIVIDEEQYDANNNQTNFFYGGDDNPENNLIIIFSDQKIMKHALKEYRSYQDSYRELNITFIDMTKINDDHYLFQFLEVFGLTTQNH